MNYQQFSSRNYQRNLSSNYEPIPPKCDPIVIESDDEPIQSSVTNYDHSIVDHLYRKFSSEGVRPLWRIITNVYNKKYLVSPEKFFDYRKLSRHYGYIKEKIKKNQLNKRLYTEPVFENNRPFKKWKPDLRSNLDILIDVASEIYQ